MATWPSGAITAKSKVFVTPKQGLIYKDRVCIDQQTQLPRSKISPQGPQPRKVGRDLCRAGNSIDPPQLELLRAQRCRKNNAIDAIICST